MAILGAGNMGTAMAHALASQGQAVALWDHFPEVVLEIRAQNHNRRFLPGVRLDRRIRACDSAEECIEGAAIVAICVPSAFVKSTVLPLVPSLAPDAILLNVAKGFVPGSREIMPALLERIAPGHACVHLAGPAIADEFARGLAAPIVMASTSVVAAGVVAEAFSPPHFHASVTGDITGAVLGGILKNVYAILLGCLDRLGGGSRNLQGAAIAACTREMAEIAAARGGDRDTLFGLAGLGDLVATGSSTDSHNWKFGQALASGTSAAAWENEHGWLPEGARAADDACLLASEKGLAAPLAEWVRDVLAGMPPTTAGLILAIQGR